MKISALIKIQYPMKNLRYRQAHFTKHCMANVKKLLCSFTESSKFKVGRIRWLEYLLAI